MSLLSMFRETFPTELPDEEICELRDRAMFLEMRAVLLQNALEAERSRRGRERRRDATDISRAIAARAQVYSDRFRDLTDEQKARAIQAAKRGRG